MIAIDADKISLGMNQIVKNEGTQASVIPYTWPHDDGMVKFF